MVRTAAVMNKPIIKAFETESKVLAPCMGFDEGFADSGDNSGVLAGSVENAEEGSSVSEGSGVTGTGLGSSGTGVGSGSGSGVSEGMGDGTEDSDGTGVSSL